MAYTHEFGIIESIEMDKDYTYEAQKYNCISIDGDFIDEIYFKEKMKNLKTFVNSTSRPHRDLAYQGITLIPPESLEEFLEILSEEAIICRSKELEEIIGKITQAIKQDRWMIHFGV